MINIGKNGYLSKQNSNPNSLFLTHWPPLGGLNDLENDSTKNLFIYISEAYTRKLSTCDVYLTLGQGIYTLILLKKFSQKRTNKYSCLSKNHENEFLGFFDIFIMNILHLNGQLIFLTRSTVYVHTCSIKALSFYVHR